MPSGDSERMDALTEAIVRLLKRVEQVEVRLTNLERGQSAVASPERPRTAPAVSPAVRPPPASGEPGVQTLPQEPGTIPPVPAFALSAEAPAEPREQPRLETRLGLTWINRIGVLTLIIGVAFFFKYAFDNQWIGQTGRVVLGVLAGLATLATGDVLWRRGQKVFAQGVCGLGVSILYLSFYASFAFYHLLPQGAAFVLMAMATAASGAFALRYDAMPIAALGMLGGFLTPLLLSTGQDAPWTFFSYLFLIDVGAVAVARPRRWRPLDAMAFLATAMLYASWFGEWFRPEKHVVATVAALAFYALFAFVEWSWIFCAAQALAGVALAAIWPETTPYLVLSLIVGAAGLAIADRTRRPAAIFSFATFWVSYGIWVSSNGEPKETGTAVLLLTIGFAMYLAWVPFERLVRKREIRTQHLTVLALNGIFYFGSSYVLLKPHYQAWLGLFAAAIAGLHLSLGMRLWKERSAAGYDSGPVLLALGSALGFLTLAVPIQFTGFSITLSWALEAAALVWISRRTKENRIWYGAAAIYMLVLFRLYAFDAWLTSAHLLVNTRFLTFVVSAVSLWLGARWLKSTRLPAAAGYVAGHFVLLSACLFELSDWVNAAVSVDNQRSVIAVSVSILMALYGVLLIGIGVTYRSALNRVLGLGLLGLVVLKLYLYDVWEASRLFRTAAFVSLGILLLLTSYLYSRFRLVIENWWKNEEAGK
ncbi:MAG: DUF2339 domain-containing protein [Acidobacteriia bacterium]|nr:DUF2339 domain-containing protein [Terriglobia bacterium]